ncbi:MAG TPA: hypothetical protein VJ969_02300 [Desulfopila sp.]|nr:hypothetical protein [Desulfopila sp.]
MKMINTYLTVLIAVPALVVGLVCAVSAANLEDHMQYRITSYTLGGEQGLDSSITTDLGPLLIAGSTAEILTENIFPGNKLRQDSASGANVFALSADYLATPDLALHGAVGVTKNTWQSLFDTEYETSWEANLGLIYNLFDNIRYEIHFGYMDAGDLFKESDKYTDVESIIMISNKLSMSF